MIPLAAFYDPVVHRGQRTRPWSCSSKDARPGFQPGHLTAEQDSGTVWGDSY